MRQDGVYAMTAMPKSKYRMSSNQDEQRTVQCNDVRSHM